MSGARRLGSEEKVDLLLHLTLALAGLLMQDDYDPQPLEALRAQAARVREMLEMDARAREQTAQADRED